jgi:hypothetical protein
VARIGYLELISPFRAFAASGLVIPHRFGMPRLSCSQLVLQSISESPVVPHSFSTPPQHLDATPCDGVFPATPRDLAGLPKSLLS